jgi:hypothetical protein
MCTERLASGSFGAFYIERGPSPAGAAPAALIVGCRPRTLKDPPDTPIK